MPALDLAVGLGVVGRGANVRHPRKADEDLEIFGDKLRSVVADYARTGVGDEFAGALENDLDIFLGHGFSQLPVYDVAAVAIQDRAEIVEGARDIDVGHINVPVLVRSVWLRKAFSFLSVFGVCPVQQPCTL